MNDWEAIHDMWEAIHDRHENTWVAQAQERASLSVAIVIGMRRQLMDDGWDEKRAEQAVLAVLMGKLKTTEPPKGDGS